MSTRRTVSARYFVYLLRCGDGTLYCGIARDVSARLAQHSAGKGARYTRGRGPLVMVLLEAAASHGDALRREAAIRRLGRAGKEALISRAGAATAKVKPRTPKAQAKGSSRRPAGSGS